MKVRLISKPILETGGIFLPIGSEGTVVQVMSRAGAQGSEDTVVVRFVGVQVNDTAGGATEIEKDMSVGPFDVEFVPGN